MPKHTLMLMNGAVALALVCPAAVHAQDAASEASANAQEATGALQDIVVTAQRRSERVQDIPLAISAFDSRQIEGTGVISIANIAAQVPSVYFGSFGANRPQLYIRGIGSRQYDPGSESSVGVFTDEVYLGRSGGSFSQLRDIERIEVLRGPQGTLYGRNTIGGAINVISKAPTPEFQGQIEAGVSNYDGYMVSAAVGGPLNASKTIQFRVAGWRDKQDGYLLNLTNGNRFQGIDNTGGRIRLAFVPNSDFRMDLTAEYLHDGDGAAFAGFNQGTGPSSTGAPANPNLVFFAAASRLPLVQPTRSLYAGYNNEDPTLDRDAYSLIAREEYDAGFATLTSITSYHRLNNDDFRDLDGSSLQTVNTIGIERSDQYTQELRITSDPHGPLSLGGRLDWIVGAFYYNDRTRRADKFILGVDSAVRAAVGTPAMDVVDARYATESYAGFGQATAHLGNFDLTLGLRYSHDKKRVTYTDTTPDALPFIAAPFVVTTRASYNSVDPRVVLSYKFNRDVNMYVSYSTGFKSGGFQYAPFNVGAAQAKFAPERIRAFEGGVKSELFDRLLRLNLAGFHYNYRNLQVNRIVDSASGPQNLISNARSSTLYGIELESMLRPTPNLDLSLNYGYLHSKYNEFTFNAAQNIVYDGTTMVRAPKHSVNAGAEYRIPIGANKLTLRADYAFFSTFYFEPGEGSNIYGSGVPLTREKGYGLLDLRAAYDFSNFRVSAYVTNLTNEKYRRSVNGLGNVVVGYAGPPRMYGLRLAYSFQ